MNYFLDKTVDQLCKAEEIRHKERILFKKVFLSDIELKKARGEDAPNNQSKQKVSSNAEETPINPLNLSGKWQFSIIGCRKIGENEFEVTKRWDKIPQNSTSVSENTEPRPEEKQ